MDFVSYSVSLYFLIGEWRPFIFKVIIKMYVLILVVLFLIWGTIVCVFSGTLCFNKHGFLLLYMISLLCSFLSSTMHISSCIFFHYCYWICIFQVVYFMNSFSLSIMTDDFAGHISLDWPSQFFNTWSCSSLFWLLKFPIFLIGFPL